MCYAISGGCCAMSWVCYSMSLVCCTMSYACCEISCVCCTMSSLHSTDCTWSIGSRDCIGGADRTFACKSQECLWQDWYIWTYSCWIRALNVNASIFCALLYQTSLSLKKWCEIVVIGTIQYFIRLDPKLCTGPIGEKIQILLSLHPKATDRPSK